MCLDQFFTLNCTKLCFVVINSSHVKITPGKYWECNLHEDTFRHQNYKLHEISLIFTVSRHDCGSTSINRSKIIKFSSNFFLLAMSKRSLHENLISYENQVHVCLNINLNTTNGHIIKIMMKHTEICTRSVGIFILVTTFFPPLQSTTNLSRTRY